MKGEFIGVRENANTFVVEKKFQLRQFGRATLYATALGLYFAEINGKRVGDWYLTPGWTSYTKTLQVQAYDVSAFLREGENRIALTVNAGWYSGKLTWNNITNFYGERPAVCAALEADGEWICCTDRSWSARESYIRESSFYDGELQDFVSPRREFSLCQVDFDKSVLIQQDSEPVRNIEEIAVCRLICTPRGEKVYDFGQNMSGVVRIRVPDEFDGTITLQFAEILVDGNFYTENLRSAKATDRFIVRGAHTLCPEFTFHGFRYMKIEGADLPPASITAIVRHTDMRCIGSIVTGNKRFDRLIRNVFWGQRDNFVDIPTDCPQRDERLGWTGDINAFCRTAAYNYDIRRFMKKWLRSLRDDQAETGEIPHVAPDVLKSKHTSALWCDCITMVPWTLYEMYGDISFLRDNYSAMKKFLAARERQTEGGITTKGFEYGDWLAMDNEKMLCGTPFGRTDVYYVSNVFYAVSLQIVANEAKILEEDEDAIIYRKKYDHLVECMRREYFTARGRLALDTVTAQVLALHFNIVPEAFRARLADELNQNVIRHGYRVSTGFAGTPFLLFALADNGYFETARRVLLQNAFPGWLYEVDMGATTVWERWDSLTPDGLPNADGMNSYNHYAYGSVMEFVYRRIAGIDLIEPGFRSIKIAPHPCKGLPCVHAEYESTSGKISVAYTQEKDKIVYRIQIPSNTTAEILLPDEMPIMVGAGTYTYERPLAENLSCDPYTVDSLVNEIQDNPKARRAFQDEFGTLFEGKDFWWKSQTLKSVAEQLAEEGKMSLSVFTEKLAAANQAFIKHTCSGE